MHQIRFRQSPAISTHFNRPKACSRLIGTSAFHSSAPFSGAKSVLKISVDESHTVSGVLQKPEAVKACYVVAHGAGAGMTHPFMEAVANGLFARGIATLRYQFPYMEQGSKRPDRPELAKAAVRAAVAATAELLPGVPLYAGGKSFGGRMTSLAQAEMPLPNVRGLIFLGFPLHAAGKPSLERAAHLANIHIPMLFLQGSRDALADLSLIEATVRKIGVSATLKIFDHADHSFHVPKKSSTTDAEVLATLLDTVATYCI